MDPPNENSERERFLIELEFVQCLSNIFYLNHLAQTGYFADPAFINYLKYLKYWQTQEYPNCLYFLDLLQDETFRERIASSQIVDAVYAQQYYHWAYYRKNRLNSDLHDS